MTKRDRTALLHGPYHAPPLRRGQRATCLVRDCDVKVTSWTDARISGPKGVPVGSRGQPSIVVTDELARAIRTESALALHHHFGVSSKVSWKWRRALGVTRTNNEGSRRLLQEVVEAAAKKLRGVKLPPDQVERRRRTALELGLGRNLEAAGAAQPGRWKEEEVALLGSDDDEVVARKLGRTRSAVRSKRCRLGVPMYRYRKGRRPRKRDTNVTLFRETAGIVGKNWEVGLAKIP